jgi:abortive infection bacteriophage resistance protein
MTFGNESKARHLLQNISYYRLSGYWRHLLVDRQRHIFLPGTDFETVFNLYKFDRELRRMVIVELEKIEVAVRSQLSYVMSTAHGHFWIDDASLFCGATEYGNILADINRELSRGNEDFIKSFRAKYSNPLPPSPMTVEIMSFGTLSRLYKCLHPGADKRSVARHFGLNDRVFESWLHSIVYIRNICAHHARMWNRRLSIPPMPPRNTANVWLGCSVPNDRLFYLLSIIVYLLNVVNPKHSFRERLRELLDRYPDAKPTDMGFPAGWEHEALWKALPDLRFSPFPPFRILEPQPELFVEDDGCAELSAFCACETVYEACRAGQNELLELPDC